MVEVRRAMKRNVHSSGAGGGCEEVGRSRKDFLRHAGKHWVVEYMVSLLEGVRMHMSCFSRGLFYVSARRMSMTSIHDAVFCRC